jgi:hypothetical protein
MIRPSLITGGLLAAVLATGSAYAATSFDTTSGGKVQSSGFILAQGGSGGGSGDSAGRGPDTSKGAVPKDPANYPSGITSPGTAPVPPAPGEKGSSSTGTTGSMPNTDTTETGTSAPGTGMNSPGTTQQGGKTRTEK